MENVWYCSKRPDCDCCLVRKEDDPPSSCPKCGALMLKYKKEYYSKPKSISWFGFGGRK